MKKLSILALILSLMIFFVGCSAQSDNESLKDTEGKTSVSVSQNTSAAQTSSKAEKSENKDNKAKNEQSTLKRAGGDYSADVITIEADEKSDNSSGKRETTTKKGEKKSKETTTSSNQTPVIPIP